MTTRTHRLRLGDLVATLDLVPLVPDIIKPRQEIARRLRLRAEQAVARGWDHIEPCRKELAVLKQCGLDLFPSPDFDPEEHFEGDLRLELTQEARR